MKRFGKFTALALSFAMLTACSKAPETAPSIETETEQMTVTESEEIPSSSEEHPVIVKDIDAQLKIIADSYQFLHDDYNPYDDYFTSYAAVTDLNHNGRLELILTSCQGSGAFSYTKFYEISEDYSELSIMETVNNNPDEAGDFTPYRDDEDHIEVYDCYEKDGEYYYLLKDYASAGWSAKYLGFYSYSFGGAVTREFVGGTSINVNDTDKTVEVWLYDSSYALVLDGDLFVSEMYNYWSDYEKQNSCEVYWITFTEEGFAEGLSDSYKGFNPDSDKTSGITFDYQANFNTFYEDEYEYVIQAE